MPKYRLTDMELDFVSLVVAGDDPNAQVVIAKASPEGKDMYVPNAGSGGSKKCSGCKKKDIVAGEKKCADCLVNKSTGTESGAPTLPRNDLPEDHMADAISKDDLDPEVVSYIEALEAEVTSLNGKVEKAAADLTEKDEQISKMVPATVENAEEIRKSVLAKADPAIRALIEKQDEAIKDAQAIAKAERDTRLDREFISKAESLPMIAEDKAALGGLLRRISESLSAEDSLAVEKTLRAANEQIAKGSLFANFGSGGGETTVSKSVDAKREEIAKAHPDWTKDQCEAEVYATNPDLFKQAMTGQES